MSIQHTFGPVVFNPDGTDELIAKCLSKNFACRGYTGGQCFWNGEPQKINDDNTTPDWCKYKADTLRDAEEMMRGE